MRSFGSSFIQGRNISRSLKICPSPSEPVLFTRFMPLLKLTIRLARCSVALLVIAALTIPARASVDLTSWDNLRQLAAGQQIEVARKQVETVKGEFVRMTDEAVTLRTGGGEITVPRSEIMDVRRGKVGRKATWIGAGVGAGAGALIGVGAGEALANESGGDFANLKPAIASVCAGVGALVGALIGSAIGNRHAIVYRNK